MEGTGNVLRNLICPRESQKRVFNPDDDFLVAYNLILSKTVPSAKARSITNLPPGRSAASREVVQEPVDRCHYRDNQSPLKHSPGSARPGERPYPHLQRLDSEHLRECCFPHHPRYGGQDRESADANRSHPAPGPGMFRVGPPEKVLQGVTQERGHPQQDLIRF